MGVIISNRTSGLVSIKNKLVKIQLGNQILSGPTWTIRLYARYNDNYRPAEADRYIEYSVDGDNYIISDLITRSTADDPDYTLAASIVGTYGDVLVRPRGAKEQDGMLGDLISLTGNINDDYPYRNPTNPYRYTTHR